MVRLERCLVGGTFDRFHAGHIALLETALAEAELVEVWIAGDEMAANKSPLIQSFDERRGAILDWCGERISTHELEDELGPAPHRADCDSIICTPETLPNCNSINEKRLHAGLTPLEIIEAEHVLDETGGIISSTRIRAGIIDRDGKAWLPNKDREAVHHFQPALDSELKEAMGELHLGPEDVPEVAMSSAIEDLTFGILVSVGDVCTATLLDMGIIPDIALVDGFTKRTELEDKVDLSPFDALIGAKNPPGQITPSLIVSIEAALHNDQTTCIEVSGEEDLAPIIIHLLAPLGTNVVYGQPGKGVVIRHTDNHAKLECRSILNRFEVR